MKPFLGNQAEITVGEPVVLESDAPSGERGVVFEDDGDTGYFYARDYRVEGKMFVDAMHIYSVKGVVDADRPSSIRIIWTRDFSKSALLINDAPYGIFDFKDKIGYCQDKFPEPDAETGWQREGWSSELKEWFYPSENAPPA